MCINVSFYQAKVLWITSSGIFNLASRPLVKVHWKILYVLKMWLYIFCLWCNGTFTSTVKYFTWSYCVQSSGSTKSSPRMTVCQGSMCKEGCEVTVFIPRNLVSCNLCHTLYSHVFVCSTVGTGFLVHLVRQCVRVQCAQTGVKSPINLVTFAIHYIAVCSCVAREAQPSYLQSFYCLLSRHKSYQQVKERIQHHYCGSMFRHDDRVHCAFMLICCVFLLMISLVPAAVAQQSSQQPIQSLPTSPQNVQPMAIQTRVQSLSGSPILTAANSTPTHTISQVQQLPVSGIIRCRDWTAQTHRFFALTCLRSCFAGFAAASVH